MVTRRNEGEVTPKYATGRSSTFSQVATTGKKKDFSLRFSVWINNKSCGSWKLPRTTSAWTQQGLLNTCNESGVSQLYFSRGRTGWRREGLVLWWEQACWKISPPLFPAKAQTFVFRDGATNSGARGRQRGWGNIQSQWESALCAPCVRLGEGMKMRNEEDNREMRMEKGTWRSSPALPSSPSSLPAPGSSLRSPSPTGDRSAPSTSASPFADPASVASPACRSERRRPVTGGELDPKSSCCSSLWRPVVGVRSPTAPGTPQEKLCPATHSHTSWDVLPGAGGFTSGTKPHSWP